jgi:hypothetical protein
MKVLQIVEELPASKVIRGGGEAGNFLANTRSIETRGCDEKFPANRQQNDVAGKSDRHLGKSRQALTDEAADAGRH